MYAENWTCDIYLNSWKVKFSGTQKASNLTVFNLQASDWLHCEEETGAHYSLYYGTSKLLKKNF